MFLTRYYPVSNHPTILLGLHVAHSPDPPLLFCLDLFCLVSRALRQTMHFASFVRVHPFRKGTTGQLGRPHIPSRGTLLPPTMHPGTLQHVLKPPTSATRITAWPSSFRHLHLSGSRFSILYPGSKSNRTGPNNGNLSSSRAEADTP
jgi:hypothetical protein